MKILIVYDSFYGNTKKIAESIGDAISNENEVALKSINELKSPDLESTDMLIVGSPTRGFRPTAQIQEFVVNLSRDSLKGIKVAAFDTRMSKEDVGFGLRILLKIGSYAAPYIDKALTKKGGKSVISPGGFYVKGKEGPLKTGEVERAVNWAKMVVKNA